MPDVSNEKQKLLSMLADIQDQLEELEAVLETSFSAQRKLLLQKDQKQIADTAQMLSILENKYQQVTEKMEGDNVFLPTTKAQNLKWALKSL
ncbi:hypothetical protein [Bacillus rubiinfantis]|uniref:hypothetical protein n=1 Tax=Bacillus rubiinfantis TaxID=1499680 RepID=UPI0005A97C67|nr:hypothetical protein [Bacillus rubiinfantis]